MPWVQPSAPLVHTRAISSTTSSDVVKPNAWVSQSAITLHPRDFLLHQSATKPACNRGALHLISLFSPSSFPSFLFYSLLSSLSICLCISPFQIYYLWQKEGTQKAITVFHMSTNAMNGKELISLGAGTHLPNKKWRTREGSDRSRQSVKYRWGQEGRKWWGRKKLFLFFYFVFFQNEFQGSSALGDVGVHGLTASNKHKLSSERTTSRHLLYRQRQREGRARKTQEKKLVKVEKENRL